MTEYFAMQITCDTCNNLWWNKVWVEWGMHIFRDRGDQQEVKMEILKNLGHFVQDVQTEICWTPWVPSATAAASTCRKCQLFGSIPLMSQHPTLLIPWVPLPVAEN